MILVDQKCPKCEGKALEKIAISEKTNKPYHRLRCANQQCDYVKWVSVEAYQPSQGK